MSFLWNVGASAVKNGYLSSYLLLFSRVSWRIALKRQRREGSFVSILCTVISKTCRPIGVQKTLGHCKSLDCVAGILRGIEKSEKRRGKGKRKKGHLFSFLLPFPSLPSSSSLVFAPVTQTTTQAIVKPIYSLWHDCDLSAVLQGSGSPYTCGPVLPGWPVYEQW